MRAHERGCKCRSAVASLRRPVSDVNIRKAPLGILRVDQACGGESPKAYRALVTDVSAARFLRRLMPTVLCVDDEVSLRRAMQNWLGRRGLEVHAARSVASARRCMTRYTFDGAFIDIWLAGETGLDLYDWMLVQHPRVAANVVFLTGDILRRPDLSARLERTGRPVLYKPFDLRELERHVALWPLPSASRQADANGRESRASV